MKKNCIALLVFCLFCLISAEAEGRNLAAGIGLDGTLEIGNSATNVDKDNWETKGIKFKVDEDNIIVLLKCKNPKYATDKNVRVGSPEFFVIRRYGKPLDVKKSKSKKHILYLYPGIGFVIKKGKVKKIYIFPK